MAKTSVPSTRSERGIRLAEEHFDRILRSWRTGGKSAICCGCGRRVRKSEIREVPEDSGSLTYFGGERLCRRCWQDSDVAW